MVERVNVPGEESLSNTPADNAFDKRPQWLPEKFSSAEDMARSYAELEKEYTRLRQGEARGRPTVTGKPDVSEQFDEEVKEQEQQGQQQEQKSQDQQLAEVKALLPGFTEDQLQEFSNTAWENGELTTDQYAALEKAGYGRQIVDDYIRGQMALMEQSTAALINAGGGEQAVDAMFQWAQATLPPNEVALYNSKFDAGGPDALMAMEHLKSRFEASGQAGGVLGGNRVTGANNPMQDTSRYESVAQVTRDMQSEQYKIDPAFRQKVAEKLKRSNVL